jgi:hypothetical protein
MESMTQLASALDVDNLAGQHDWNGPVWIRLFAAGLVTWSWGCDGRG